MRMDWAELPPEIAKEVGARVGEHHVTPASAGDHAEIAVTVTGANATVFVKAACTDFGVRSLRFEQRVSEAAAMPHSPEVEWHFEAAGWLVVAFEHCAGPHADLSPGSPDLELLDQALTTLAVAPAPDVQLFTPQQRLGFDHPAMTGNTLIHTDLGQPNLIVTPQGLRIVDWAMAALAQPWVELAMLTPWLISAGHTPAQADRWLTRRPAWTQTDPAALNYFAAKNAQKWAAKAAQSTAPWVHSLAAWTAQWAEYRLSARPLT
jgi:hypothetical protein